MFNTLANMSSFTATLVGALIGSGITAVVYVSLPSVRAFYHWQWSFMTAHPVSFVVCAAIGLAVGYFSDRD